MMIDWVPSKAAHAVKVDWVPTEAAPIAELAVPYLKDEQDEGLPSEAASAMKILASYLILWV